VFLIKSSALSRVFMHDRDMLVLHNRLINGTSSVVPTTHLDASEISLP
jgi:hypothetical protein